MYNLLSISASGGFAEVISSFFAFAKEAFLGFQINDAIDIILLTVLFFLIFNFCKNKKAGALILGIIICLVVLVLSILFELSGMQFILSGVFQIGALALVIIFQPELRELLEKMGSGSLKGIRSFSADSRKKQDKYQMIKNITKATHMLSMEKTGALIVIERTIGLDDILHSGMVINADVSDSLLRNLFFTKAPLHDGAVVIDNDRIAAASCILPLSKNTPLDSDLGTRHRAAVGVSEISDAIAIVVSEETGIISVAKEGELIRDFTSDTLRKFLVKELLREGHEEENN